MGVEERPIYYEGLSSELLSPGDSPIGPLRLAMAAFCASALAVLVLLLVSGFPSLGEIGYPDSSVMYDVLSYQSTGRVYRDLSEAPFTPSMYGPLGYRLLAVPGALYPFSNPFLGPRIAIFLCFLGCIGATASITRHTVGLPRAGLWGAAFACSFFGMQKWILQVRADFPAVLCGLISVRLVLSAGPRGMLLAGMFAGTAPLFKQSHIAVLAGCTLWLMLMRRWADMARFVSAGLATVVLGYTAFVALEPNMLDNFAALNPVLLDLPGAVLIAGGVLREPVLLMGLATVAVGWRLSLDRAGLVLLASVVSGVAALATSLQAGANTNYYFEMLFLSVPVAVLGFLRFTKAQYHSSYSTVMLTGVVLIYFAAPNVIASVEHLSSLDQSENNSRLIAFQGALEDRHFLSFDSRVAAMDDAPPMLDPFLHAEWELAGKADALNLTERIRRQEYEVIVTHRDPWSYRGIQFPNPAQVNAIDEAYAPHCASGDLTVHLPNGSLISPDLAADLRRADCRATEIGWAATGAM